MQFENLKNIMPALTETPSSHMSSKEFQRSLYAWFEEKGLVSDLRSYLRVLMIKELKNTKVGKVDSRTNFSLPKQAFSLLIAEHLLREGCHYTLSIFSTEVPAVANQLPSTLYEAHCHDNTWRFDEESIVNVLELLGISKASNESLRIVALYLRSQNSLLTCLVNSKGGNMVDLSQIGNDGDYLINVLTTLGLPSNMADNVRRKCEDKWEQKIPLDRQELQKLRSLLLQRNNELKLLVDEQVTQKKENKQLRCELRETQRRLKHALNKEYNLNLRETEMRKKLDEVARLQRSLEKSITKEKIEVCSLKHCGDSCSHLADINEKLKEEIVKLEQANQEKVLETEHLNSKISALTKELQNARLNIEFLNTCLLRSSQMNLQDKDNDHALSSEESSETMTGEILKQVRCRLHQLERESEEIDVKFRKLKMNDFVTK